MDTLPWERGLFIGPTAKQIKGAGKVDCRRRRREVFCGPGGAADHVPGASATVKFPANRQNSREFFFFRPSSRKVVAQTEGIPETCNKIPYAAEQRKISQLSAD